MRQSPAQAPPAQVTLRAYLPAPAWIELVYQPLPQRLARTLFCLLVFWGSVPFLFWIPPHYPWVIGALIAGFFLAHRQWTGRYLVRAFAGICPRCSHPLSLGPDHTISLPHTLTCFHCHFEPTLEVRFPSAADRQADGLGHHSPECVGRWGLRWLADEPFMVCDHCHASRAATADTRAAAAEENEHARLLAELTREGGLM